MFPKMNAKEKGLYHQIHPAKLLVDIFTGLLSTYFLWQHDLKWFFVVFLIPSILVSFILIRYGNLDKLKNSRFGKYIQKFMSPIIVVARMFGQVVMWIGGWYHIMILIIVGFMIIIIAWCYGIFRKKYMSTQKSPD
jgi:hypothetical protein